MVTIGAALRDRKSLSKEEVANVSGASRVFHLDTVLLPYQR